MKLVDEQAWRSRFDFRGDEVVIESMTPPHKPSSAGQVYVKGIKDD
jgi:hypothetical protein